MDFHHTGRPRLFHKRLTEFLLYLGLDHALRHRFGRHIGRTGPLEKRDETGVLSAFKLFQFSSPSLSLYNTYCQFVGDYMLHANWHTMRNVLW